MTRYLLTALLLFGLLSCGGTEKETHPSQQPGMCAKEEMAADGIVRLSKIEVYPQFLDEYIRYVTEVGEISLRTEPGVLTMYAIGEKENPCQITILETYASREAYDKHIASAHFQKYKQGTLHMVKSLELTDQTPLNPDNRINNFIKQYIRHMKKILFLLFVVTMTNIQGIMAQEKITQTAEADGKAAFQREMIFPIGEPNTAYAKYFIGNSYLAPISKEQIPFNNVTFEPGCRNNWHIHHATKGGGQMLVCVAGKGWYQEEGKPAVQMLPGDVIHIPANVKHWHGAAADSWFAHLAFEVPGENTSNEWLEPVTDEEYNQLGK